MPLFTRIDSTTIGDHFRLVPGDEVYYVYEYTSGRNFAFSTTNSLISNLKKKPSRRLYPEYRHKTNAMRECSRLLAEVINPEWLQHGTLIPVPPSKARDHAEYDDRIRHICEGIPVHFPLDVREIIVQSQSTDAAHESDVRLSVAQLLEIYSIDENVCAPAPQQIAIVDDVLTVGTHFRAMHTLLGQRFPGVPIVGMFIARRVFPAEEIGPPNDLGMF